MTACRLKYNSGFVPHKQKQAVTLVFLLFHYRRENTHILVALLLFSIDPQVVCVNEK